MIKVLVNLILRKRKNRDIRKLVKPEDLDKQPMDPPSYFSPFQKFTYGEEKKSHKFHKEYKW